MISWLEHYALWIIGGGFVASVIGLAIAASVVMKGARGKSGGSEKQARRPAAGDSGGRRARAF